MKRFGNASNDFNFRLDMPAVNRMTGADWMEALFGPQMIDEEAKIPTARPGGLMGAVLDNAFGRNNAGSDTPAVSPAPAYPRIPTLYPDVSPAYDIASIWNHMASIPQHGFNPNIPLPGQNTSTRGVEVQAGLDVLPGPDWLKTGLANLADAILSQRGGAAPKGGGIEYQAPEPAEPPTFQEAHGRPARDLRELSEYHKSVAYGTADPTRPAPPQDWQTGNPLIDNSPAKPADFNPLRALVQGLQGMDNQVKSKAEASKKQQAARAPEKPASKNSANPISMLQDIFGGPVSSSTGNGYENVGIPMPQFGYPGYSSDNSLEPNASPKEKKPKDNGGFMKAAEQTVEKFSERGHIVPAGIESHFVRNNMPTIDQASRSFGVNPKLVAAILLDERQQSSYLEFLARHGTDDPSEGMGQVKVSTAKELLKKYPQLQATVPSLHPNDNKAKVIDALNDDRINIFFAAAAVKDIQDKWRQPIEAQVRRDFLDRGVQATSKQFRDEVNRRLEIAAATMYHLGSHPAHGNPQPDPRARTIIDKYERMF